MFIPELLVYYFERNQPRSEQFFVVKNTEERRPRWNWIAKLTRS